MTIDFLEYTAAILHKRQYEHVYSPTIFFYLGKRKLSFSCISDKDRLASVMIDKVFKKVFPDIMTTVLLKDDNRISLSNILVIVDGLKSQEMHVKSLLQDAIRKASYREAGKSHKVLANEIYDLIIKNSNQLINGLPLEHPKLMTTILNLVVARSINLSLDYIKDSSAYKLLHSNALARGRDDAEMWLFSQFTNVISAAINKGAMNALKEDFLAYALRNGFISSETTFLDLDDVFFNKFLPSLDLSQLTSALNKSIKEELKKMFASALLLDVRVDCMELCVEMSKANLDEIADKMLMDALQVIYESTINQELRQGILLLCNPSDTYHIECIFNLIAIYKYSRGIKSCKNLMYSHYLRCILIKFFNDDVDVQGIIERDYGLFDYHGSCKLTKEQFKLLFPDIVIMVMAFYISLEFNYVLLEKDASTEVDIFDIMKFLKFFCESNELLDYSTTSVLSGATRWMILKSFGGYTELTSGCIDIDSTHVQIILDRMYADGRCLRELFTRLYKHLKDDQSCSTIKRLENNRMVSFNGSLNLISEYLRNASVREYVRKVLLCNDDFEPVLLNCFEKDLMMSVIRYELLCVVYHMYMNHSPFMSNDINEVKECILANSDKLISMVDDIIVRQVYRFLHHNVRGRDYLYIFDSKDLVKERNIIMSYVLFILNILFSDNQLTPEFLGLKNIPPVCGFCPPLFLVRSRFEFEDAFKAVIKETINPSIVKNIWRVIDGQEALISAINMIDVGCSDKDDYKLCIASIILTRIIIAYTFQNILYQHDFKRRLYDLLNDDKLLLLFNSVPVSVFNIFLYKTCFYNNSLTLLGLCRNKGLFNLENTVLLKINALMEDVAFMQHIGTLSEECFNAFKIHIIPQPAIDQPVLEPVDATFDKLEGEDVAPSPEGATEGRSAPRKDRRHYKRRTRAEIAKQHMLELGEEKAELARKKEEQLAREQEERMAREKDTCASADSILEQVIDTEPVLPSYTEEEQFVRSVFLQSIPSMESILGCKFSEEQIENLVKEHIKTYHLTKGGGRSQLVVLHDEGGEGISAKDTSVAGKTSLGIGTDEADVEDLDSIWEDGSISSKSMKRLNDEASSAPIISFFWNQAFEKWLEVIIPAERKIILGKFRDMQDSGLLHHKPLALNVRHRVYEFKIIYQYRIYFILINKNVHIIHAGDKKNQKVFLENGIHACLAKWMSCNPHICK